MRKSTTIIFVLSIISAFSFSVSAQTGGVRGTVTTSDGKPGEGVTVIVKGLSKSTIADNDGRFSIAGLKAGSYTLTLSLIGHKDLDKEVEIVAGQITEISIQLSLSENELGQVVVMSNKSAFKTNRLSSSLRLQSSILETPQNIQVITGKLMGDQQIFDMLDGVTRNVSGATRVEHWDNYANIFMRGSQVSAFRNGMNVSTAWGPLTEDMSMVERIEFVKGPAGFMLANGNPSGFYNVVTKKPSGRNKGEATISLGSFDFYRATLDLDGKLSKDGKLLYRINLMGELKGSHRQYDYNNRYSIVPVLKYLIDDKSSITLEYTQQFSQVNIIGSNYVFSKRKYADLPRDFTNGEPNFAPTNMLDRSILAIFEHRINNDWKLTAQASFMNYTQEGMSMWPAWPDAFSPTNDSLLNRRADNWDVLGLTKIGQVYLNGEFKTGTLVHKVLGGIDMSDKLYYHDWSQSAAITGYGYDDNFNQVPVDFNIYAPVHGNVPADKLPAFDRSRNIRERGVQYQNSYFAGYLQDEIGFFNDRLRLTLAGRFTNLKASNPYSGAAKNSKLTPRAGLSYSISKNSTAYFVYDQSFNENYGSDWQGKNFNPQTGTNLEIGFKKDWLNGKWNSVISAYQITLNNVLTLDPEHSTGAVTYYKQSGQQRGRGLEVDIRGQVARNLDIIFNYAFTEAKVTKDTDPEMVGNQVPGTSRHINNAWVNYRIDEGFLSGLGFSLGYQYQIDRTPWYVPDATQLNLPDYFRLDGSISYQKQKLSLNLIVNNILGSYLYSGSIYTDYYYWQTEPGTNLRFTIGYKF